jgi:hypothetical protein
MATMPLHIARAVIVNGSTLGMRSPEELRRIKRWAYEKAHAQESGQEPGSRGSVENLYEIAAACDVVIADAEKDQLSIFGGG